MAEDLIINNLLPVKNLYGLVVCGGKSTRMGCDKSMLQYFNKPQRYYLYDMLKPICEKVFISCNASQAEEIPTEYETITDLNACSNIGPMASLISALTKYPENNFLVVGCDYPYLTVNELYSFIFSNQEETAAAFYDDVENVYDPLLACYHHSSFQRLLRMYATGKYSLQQFLQAEGAARYHPLNKKAMISVDTKHDFLKAKKAINLIPQWNNDTNLS